ncbi:MAG: fimbrillin family protein [Paramuribaculum sp.]|nr:fimbrillin family protein [Paramuribaculum sp.]
MACMLSACDSDMPDGSTDTGVGTEVSFTTSGLSRASDTPSFDRFAVYGDMRFQGDDDAAPLVIFDKKEVEYQNGRWTYSGVQYWFQKHIHSFVAVSPVSVVDPAANPQYSDSRLSFTYTIPTTGGVVEKKDDISDICVATHRRLYVSGNAPVTLKFRHIQSLVNVALALDDDLMKKDEYVLINELEVSGIKAKADFSILPSAILTNNQTDDNVVEIAGQEGDAKLTVIFDEPVKLVNKANPVNLFAANDALIMLPQVFAVDSKAKIVFTYTVNGDAEAPKKITLSFKDMKWDVGKSYTYQGSFEIDKTQIELQSMGITDWTEEELSSEAVSD